MAFRAIELSVFTCLAFSDLVLLEPLMQLQVVALPETALETPMSLFYCGFLSASSSVPACWRSMLFSGLSRGRILQVDL